MSVSCAQSSDVADECIAASIGKRQSEEERAALSVTATIAGHAGIVRRPAWARYALPTLRLLIVFTSARKEWPTNRMRCRQSRLQLHRP